jgi:hypothetical protein
MDGDAIYFLASRNTAAINGNSRRIPISTLKTDLYLVRLSLSDGMVAWEQPVTFSGGTPVVYMMAADQRVERTDLRFSVTFCLTRIKVSRSDPRRRTPS